MKDKICCSTCKLMKEELRTGNTLTDSTKTPRGQFYCKHEYAAEASALICAKSHRGPGFIAFTKKGGDGPAIKTAPRWCPRRLEKEPVEITKKEAYEIISTSKPHGLFYLKEGDGYTGIDNRTGETFVEEFSSKAWCLIWLKMEVNRSE